MAGAQQQGAAAAASYMMLGGDDQRWGIAETRQLIAVRAEHEQDFANSKGNGIWEARVWELVAGKMGFQCTADECKREWKKLVARYKEKKVLALLQEKKLSGFANGHEFPFFDELDAIFKSRSSLVNSDPVSELNLGEGFTFSEEDSSSNDSQDDDESYDEREDPRGVQEVLEDLFQQQQRAELLWQEAMEKGVHERRLRAAGMDEATASMDLHAGSLLQAPAIPMLEDASKCKQEVLEDRMPRWGYPETKEFIAIRAELEIDVSHYSQKNLWEPIAAKMKERGYSRSAEQCKRKWKKLVNRYKGKRLSGHDNGRKFPFFEDLDALFQARLQKRARPLLEADFTRQKKLKDDPVERSLVDLACDKSVERDLNGHVSEDGDSADGFDFQRKKRRTDGMHQVLADFITRQQHTERQWQEFLLRRQREWQRREQEWRSGMERLQQQRIGREIAWREREEQRRVREEARAQKWDKLFAVLVSKVAKEG